MSEIEKQWIRQQGGEVPEKKVPEIHRMNSDSEQESEQERSDTSSDGFPSDMGLEPQTEPENGLESESKSESDENEEYLQGFRGFDYLQENQPNFPKELAATMVQMKGLKASSNGFRTLRKHVSGAVTLREAQRSVRQAKLEALLQHQSEQTDAIHMLEEIAMQSPVMETIPERLRRQLVPKDPPFVTPLPEGSIVFLYDGERDHVLGKSTGEELVERNPSMADRVFSFDIKRSRSHDVHGRLWT